MSMIESDSMWSKLMLIFVATTTVLHGDIINDITYVDIDAILVR